MARKPHLVQMTDQSLEEYRTQLVREHLAVLVEQGLREEWERLRLQEDDVDYEDKQGRLPLE